MLDASEFGFKRLIADCIDKWFFLDFVKLLECSEVRDFGGFDEWMGCSWELDGEDLEF